MLQLLHFTFSVRPCLQDAVFTRFAGATTVLQVTLTHHRSEIQLFYQGCDPIKISIIDNIRTCTNTKVNIVNR